MNVPQRIATALNIKPGEGRLVGLLFAHSFGMGAARTFSKISVYALFLTQFDVSMLPFIYVAAAAIGTTFSVLTARMGPRASVSKVVTDYLVFTLSGFVVFGLALCFVRPPWIIFLLPIWDLVLVTMSNTEFGTVNTTVLTVRQSKRLLGLIGSGEFVAEIAVGLVAAAIVALIGTSNLLFLAAAAVVVSLLLALRVLAAHSIESDRTAKGKKSAARNGVQKQQRSIGDMFRDRYVFLIFFFMIAYALNYFFVESAFYDQVNSRFENDTTMAGFLGQFSAVTGLLSLVSLAGLSGWVLNRYGILTGLLIMPVGVLGCTVLLLGTHLLDGPAGWVFWLAVVAHAAKNVLKSGFSRPARDILFQVLPADQRPRAISVGYNIVTPIANGATGLLLWVLMNQLGFRTVELFWGLFVVLVVWIVSIAITHKEYLSRLVQAIAKRRLTDIAFSIDDRSSITTIKQGLSSSHPSEVIHCMDLLYEMEYGDLDQVLRGLLKHPVPEIRQEALIKIGRLNIAPALAEARSLLEHDASPRVRWTAMQTVAALSEEEAVDTVLPYLEHADSEARKSAMVCLLRSCGMEGLLLAGEKLLAMVKSPDSDERRFAAEVFGASGNAGFYRNLMPILEDENLQVRKQALAASAKLKNPKLLPLVLENLTVPSLRTAAVFSLIRMGEAALPGLKSYLDDAEHSLDVRAKAVRVIGHIKGEEAIRILAGRLDQAHRELRRSILNGLARCGFRAEGDARDEVRGLIDQEMQSAAWVFACLVDLGDDEALAVLRRALEQELKAHVERIMLLLSFLFDSESMLGAKAHLDSRSSEMTAYALEIVDSLIPLDLKDLIFPLLEGVSPDEGLMRLQSKFPQQSLSRADRIHQILTDPEALTTLWTRCCALAVIDESHRHDYTELAVKGLSSAEPLLREMALWFLGRMDLDGVAQHLHRLEQDESPSVANLARAFADQKGEPQMRSIIERVIILKTVSIFSDIPDELLARIAQLTEEVEVKAGEELIAQGELGTSMYIIVSGKVRAHVGDEELAVLEDRQVFGEFAALSSEPRSASISALEDSYLFILEAELLYDLMEERFDVARKIINVLCDRISKTKSTFDGAEPQMAAH